ncbi:MAG: SAM-dependent methyltransferase, partial [Verrucomicrobiota bacterium]
MKAIDLAENGLVPYWLIRHGIRERLKRKLVVEREKTKEQRSQFIEGLRESPVATDTDKANEQHYELPPEFFELILGPHLKYSS